MTTGSLTPASRRQEATDEATWEGIVNGFLVLIPSIAGVAVAMRNPAFVRRTNWQSRTAISIMPALFVFGLTSERRLDDKMRSIAAETTHANQTVRWADEQQAKATHATDFDRELLLTELYRQSVTQTGVRVVPGSQLRFHHVAANYVAANPIKVLAAFAVPSVAWIFYGRTGKEHLDFSVKLLHTRVFGQFATISLLLSVMGFKEFMDHSGRFITQAEADARVDEIKRVRQALMQRLEMEKDHEDAVKRELKEAHEEVMKEKEAKKNKRQHVATSAIVQDA